MTLGYRADLLRSVVRATRLRPLVISSVVGVLVVAIPLVGGARLDLFDVSTVLHLALVATLTGAAFVLDDPTYGGLLGLPVSARTVTVVRVALATVIVSVAWGLQLLMAPHLDASGQVLPRAGLSIEAYGLVVWIWVMALGTALRRQDGIGGTTAAPVFLLSSFLITLLPDDIALFVNVADPDFGSSRWRWSLVLLAGILMFTLVLRRPSRRG